MEIDTNKFKTELETELKELEEELKTVGRKNPSNTADWEATQGDPKVSTADRNEVADGIEQYQEHSAILNELEIRYNNVKRALAKIEGGKYGICEISGEEIELDRLEANPAARTCKAHMNEKVPGI